MNTDTHAERRVAPLGPFGVEAGKLGLHGAAASQDEFKEDEE